MQVMLMRLMSKGEYLIVPKGTKFTGSGKLGLRDQGIFTPVGAQGGFHGTPMRKPFSHQNFVMKFAPYMYGL